MTTFTAETPLFEVLRHPLGRRLISDTVPGLVDSPVLHTLHAYPVGLVIDVHEATRGDAAARERILSRLAAIDPAIPASPEERETHVPPRADYEDDSILRGSATVTVPTTAQKWGRIEITIDGPSHGNPFVDVELSATFESGGERATAPGFYDGDGIYRIRFMPPTEGRWRFSTSSSARSLDGLRGEFEVIATLHRHGPVRVANTFHFAHADGTPLRPIGTTAYAWTHQGRELEERTLDTLANGPFNKMRMCVFPKSYLFNENEPELYPFEGSLEQGWDFQRFNPEFFRHLERRIGQLGELGIQADLILFHAYDRWGFSTMDPVADDRYVRYVVARLASFENVWWSLANEYDLLHEKTIDDWERFAEIVQRDDPSDHLLSIHNCMPFYDYSRPWVTHCSIQRQDVYKTAELTDEWRRTWGKPVVIDECAYEGDIDQGWGNITGEELVRRFWEGAVRGGYVGHGETYLDDADVLWWSKGGVLKGTSPDRIAFLHRIMSEGPVHGLEPLTGDWDVPRAGVEGQYYLSYFGFFRPRYRNFVLRPGTRYRVDVIDTWNMTITELDGEFEGRFRIELPGRQFMAVRMRAVGT